jgi:hypothetical protein
VIHVIKYIATAVMSIVLFFTNVSLYHSALDRGAGLFRKIVVHEGQLGFDRSAQAVSFFLDDTASLVRTSLITDGGWLRELFERRLVHGVYLEQRGFSTFFGDPFTQLKSAGDGYHIDEGALHYVYRRVDGDIYIDALINPNRFSEFIAQLTYKPHFILLYDRNRGGAVILYGRPWKLPHMVYRRLEEQDTVDFFMVTNKIITARMIGGREGELAVISLYGLRVGQNVVSAIALMGLLAAAILLLILSTRYNVSGELYFRRGVFAMPDKQEEQDVIHEIDREISDLIEEEIPPEPTPETATPAEEKEAVVQPKDKSPAAEEGVKGKPLEKKKPVEKTEQLEAEDEQKKLEKDGIIIKKG